MVIAPCILMLGLGLGGCTRSCEDLAAEARAKSADAMHMAADAYADGASTEKIAAKMSNLQKDMIDLRNEMAGKNCPMTF
ncbi:hypothetical protein ASD39_03895 [Sphingomonas sp. Root50]|nr:hypothetical protein ASD17_07375 [Sphingomonas sp. Root1294]KQY68560.1 hypothetical protein ASD39_03895 [Sphingomonas sp. Root50]KRB87965.1 hypothetical protein ASE22_21070 [Sphingomonas sp. Root720]